MFASFLDQHPLESLLSGEPFSLFPPARNREAWENIPAAYRKELLEMDQRFRELPYPLRRATDFLAFVRSGSRAADEQPYFQRRRKLCAAALGCCIDPAGGDLDQVIDGIWCLCEESSWVISAHNINPIPGAPRPEEIPLPQVDKPYIDLFAAQTGMILALVSALLAEELDGVTPLLRARIRRELERRILKPFLETEDFWWMGVRRKDLCNWTPWILSNLMMTTCALNLPRRELAGLLDRACRMLDRWLEVVPEDGGCDEGAGYWNMAGGALLDCLELLERVTAGRMTFWQEEKLRNILTFPRKVEIGDGWFLNFADCDARPFLSGERLRLAGEKLGDPALIDLGLRAQGTLEDQLSDVPHFSRLLAMLFHPAQEAPEAPPAEDVWLPDLQVRLVRRGGMVLGCKGGHNEESHNHNDVGSFLLYDRGRPVILDAGNMTYTAKTFSDQRYTLWNTRSAYHNLPLIGGCEQRPGQEFRARQAACLPEGLALELAGAYGPEASVRSLARRMTLTETGFQLRDRILLEEEKAVSWIFLLREKPEIKGQVLWIGPFQGQLPEGWEAEVQELPVEDPRMARSFPGSLWRLELKAPTALEYDFTLKLERMES